MSIASYVLLEGLSHGEFFTNLHLSLDPRPDGVFVVVWHDAALDLSGTCSLITHNRHVGSVGGTGLCRREKDIAEKPLWKVPNFPVVGSQ